MLGPYDVIVAVPVGAVKLITAVDDVTLTNDRPVGAEGSVVTDKLVDEADVPPEAVAVNEIE